MSDTWNVEHLLKGLGSDLDVFTLEKVTPQSDPGRYLCYIRSSTLKETYDVPEYETSICVYYDAEHKLLGMFMRVDLDIDPEGYGWAVNFLNEFQVGSAMTFSQMSIITMEFPEENREDGEDTFLMLECGYHLSMTQHLPSKAAHRRLMTAMTADAMKRLFTEAHYMLDEIINEYDSYLEAPRN